MTMPQVVAQLNDGEEKPDADAIAAKRESAQRKVLGDIRSAFGLSVNQLVGQPLQVTQSQIAKVHPAAARSNDAWRDLANAITAYAEDNS